MKEYSKKYEWSKHCAISGLRVSELSAHPEDPQRHFVGRRGGEVHAYFCEEHKNSYGFVAETRDDVHAIKYEHSPFFVLI